MQCPNCGTQLPVDAIRCHFCGYSDPQLGEKEISDSSKSISSFETAQIAMLSVVTSSFALIIGASNSFISSGFSQYSTTEGNITTTHPIMITLGNGTYPATVITTLMAFFLVMTIWIVFFFVSNFSRNCQNKKKDD